ncbi:MAG: hypothetical protein JKY10_06375 [Cohaesibacteraceae bacterium]|nr:hypothetical protein [Cohaesibacteraceae bacterium]
MDRAAIGLGSAFLHLDAELNFYQLFQEQIDGFDLDSLTVRQQSEIELAGLLCRWFGKLIHIFRCSRTIDPI